MVTNPKLKIRPIIALYCLGYVLTKGKSKYRGSFIEAGGQAVVLIYKNGTALKECCLTMDPFMLYWIASIVLTVVWSLFVIKVEQQHRRFLGLSGAWIAALVLTALWQAEAVPHLWIYPKAVLLVWQLALVLLVIDTVTTWHAKQPSRQALTTFALLSITVNVVAGLHLLWLATVSPGGV